MPVGELIGLIFAMLLLGGAVGGAVAMSVASGRRRRDEHRQRQLEAYARWLAARRTLTQASISLVTAFRCLAVQRRDSAYSELRVDEAQRARAYWCDALRELDRAEAALAVRTGPWGTDEPWTRVDRVGANALQVAIDGAEAGAKALHRALQEADRRAAELVQAEAASLDKRSRAAEVLGSYQRAGRWITAFIDQWSRP